MYSVQVHTYRKCCHLLLLPPSFVMMGGEQNFPAYPPRKIFVGSGPKGVMKFGHALGEQVEITSCPTKELPPPSRVSLVKS
jgi:hypothetical protein